MPATVENLSDREFKRILVVMLSRLGDVIFALPTVAAIRRRFPSAHLAWIVEDRFQELLAGHPHLDELLVWPRAAFTAALRNGRWGTAVGHVRRLRQELRARGFDLALDLQALAKSAFITWLSGAPVRLVSPSTHGPRELSWLVSVAIPSDTSSLQVVARNLAVARALGAETSRPEFVLPISPAAEAAAEELLSEAGIKPLDRVVLVHPGATWRSRRWSPVRYAELADALARQHEARVAFVGAASDAAPVREIQQRMRTPSVDLAGRTTLVQLAALIRRADLYIGNDAGPLHLATALGTPTVGIYGPTDPRMAHTAVVRHPVPCGPCRYRTCGWMDCMKLVRVEEVLRLASSQLEGRRVGGS
ncbi:MAG: glycosyltransferase family 9 protein [Deltaproteobacteria bacterium]|nr:glycosyltransferase family 9 protein [Deltaproteobacteria bacterium]